MSEHAPQGKDAPPRTPASVGTRSTPPVSRRDQPKFASRERRNELARAFESDASRYEQLRPGYPEPILDVILQARDVPRAPRVVDLGAGTGKLSQALHARGAHVTAVDTGEALLQVLAENTPDITTVLAPAEQTGLPENSADLVTAAQAWHWFDADAVTAEAARLLSPDGTLALVWNTLDVGIPWVHRLSRIMHAGDVLKDNFVPPVDDALVELTCRAQHRWEDPRTTHEIINLAYTRSYVMTATEQRRARVLTNLDWYLHEHLGHSAGARVGLPYRTDLFLYRLRERTPESTGGRSH